MSYSPATPSFTNVQSVNANTVLTTWSRTVLVDTTGGSVTITLPTAVGNNGLSVQVKKIDSSSNTVVVQGTGGQTIDGVVAVALGIQNQTGIFTSNGTNVNETSGLTPLQTDFAEVARVTDLAGVALNSDIVFDAQLGSSNLAYNTGTGVFSLIAGKRYVLSYNLIFTAITTGATGDISVQWVDSGSNLGIVNNGGVGRYPSQTLAVAETVGPCPPLIYQPGVNQGVKLRVIAFPGGGTATLTGAAVGLQSSALVRQIAGF